ncbi:MAG: HAD family hydrolase [Candidatus Eremiobacteraeota bacterium]|nr:HAD family hydrolase [Candidatus Eremiobacteraeota bacterium]
MPAQRKSIPIAPVLLVLMTALVFARWGEARERTEPLPSWNGGAAKAAVISFVDSVTSGPGALPPEERIVVTDNDGTLIVEKPRYVQYSFVLDRVRELSWNSPPWRNSEPYRAIIDGNREIIDSLSGKDAVAIDDTIHEGITGEAYRAAAARWLGTARHPRFSRPYPALVYQPMRELLQYLVSRGFKVYICSAGSTEFIRALAPSAYGIPFERIIGSEVVTRFTMDDGRPLITRTSQHMPFVEREYKPLYIQQRIGRVPVMAIGNSNGDVEMFQYVKGRKGPSMALLLHHDDGDREYCYDGGAEKALELAGKSGWTTVSMKKDFRKIFPFEKPSERK